MGIVESRAENLAARQILECRRDAPAHCHRAGINRLTPAKTGQRRAKGALQKNRFDQVAARLLDGDCRKLAIIERALAHDAIDCPAELLLELLERELRERRLTAPVMGKQAMRALDGFFSAFGSDIHVNYPCRRCGWSAAARRPRARPGGSGRRRGEKAPDWP